MPFSSSVTLDENRSLLPPYQNRPPIYCYYDSSLSKKKETKDAESELLLTWRRAWWAKGFKPIILSEAEAVNHPYYQSLRLITEKHKDQVSTDMKNEVMRWLAFENMQGGILAHHLIFPMSRYDDPLLNFLRRGDYPRLTRWEGFGSALFVGTKEEVSKAITELLDHSDLVQSEDVISALPDNFFAVEPSHKALAFYKAEVLAAYGGIAEEKGASKVIKLNKLINAHLHVSFQNSFRKGGINVLKPRKPMHASEMISPALQLAKWLALCPSDSPVPESCPPNKDDCIPCTEENPINIFTGQKYLNRSDMYTIGTIPHPLTLALLDTMKKDIDVRYVRREMQRDQFLEEALDSAGAHQLLVFKEAVAKDASLGNSLWLEAERGEPDSNSTVSLAKALEYQVNLDWYFGFHLNRADTGGVMSVLDGETQLSNEDRNKEREIITVAKKLGKSKDLLDERLSHAVEAWNLQDTEAWRFARAFRAREEVERAKFEEDEAKYVGGAGSEKDMRRGWLD